MSLSLVIAIVFLFVDIFLFLYNFCDIEIITKENCTLSIDNLKCLIFLSISAKSMFFGIPVLYILSFF